MFQITNEFLVLLLTFVLVFFISSLVLKRFLRSRAAAIIGGLAISLIAIRYLSSSQIELIFENYGLAGTAILILFPFSMVFFFVYSSDLIGPIRKAIWVFYGIVMIGIMQVNDTISSENLTSSTVAIIFITIIILFVDNYLSEKIGTFRNLRKGH